MHIIPPLIINAGTHFTYPQRDGGLSQYSARLSQEWALNQGPHVGRSTSLPTDLSQLIYSNISRSGPRASTNRDRIRCFKWREYDHFAKDCLNVSETEKEQLDTVDA